MRDDRDCGWSYECYALFEIHRRSALPSGAVLGRGLRKAMSKKDRKIKALKREVKELKARLRKLKSTSRRKRATVRKTAKSASRPAAKSGPAAKSQAPVRTDIDTPAEMAAALKSISAVRTAGQR